MKHKILLLITFCVIFIQSNKPAFCQIDAASSFAFNPKIYLYPGLFYPVIETTVRFDPHGNSDIPFNGTKLNLENDLGLSSSGRVFRMRGVLGSGTSFDVSYLSIERQASKYIEREIIFGDTVYHAGALTDAYFNSKIYSGSWKFAIVNTPVVAAGLSLGARWLELGAGLSVFSEGNRYKQEVTAELPVLLPGFHGRVSVTSRLRAAISFEYLKLHIQDFEGKAIDHRFSLEYYPLKNLGIGADYSMMNYKLNKAPFHNDFSGEINYSLKGFGVFATLRF